MLCLHSALEFRSFEEKFWKNPLKKSPENKFPRVEKSFVGRILLILLITKL